MKQFLWFTLLLSLLLGACSSRSTAPVLEASSTPPDAPTQAAIQPITPEPGMVSAEPGCTVVSPVPTPGPTIQAMFPVSEETDWARGLKTASVTIIEYSDFQ